MMPNRLANETSPYLLQHAGNPVDWYPWGSEALARARQDDRPIFLSIGYSACHWCHVMEHESFENPAIAAQLNAGFVSIKVDREERPDLDQIYMSAVQMLTGRGGWPMSVFLTPELKPFYGGTYFPPHARMGMPGFDQVLAAVLDAWKNRRTEVTSAAQRLTDQLTSMTQLAVPAEAPTAAAFAAAQGELARLFDPREGGIGGAPKFPHAIDLRLLLRLWQRDRNAKTLDMVRLTLDKMAAGGIYDHLGGGFHRYSVDDHWLVPHFEKMLYDNALLASCYIEAFQATGDERYAQVVRETLDYVLREMRDPAGGFRSTQDADSEGEEGKFYVWKPAEVEEVLGTDRARTFCCVYDVSDAGNFEASNILNRPKPLDQCARVLHREPDDLEEELANSRKQLLAARAKRVAPALDDKVLVNWNGLMIAALAQAGAALGVPAYVAAAAQAANFILERMRRDDGRLLHAYRNGAARFDGYLDDYACLADALVSLYEADFDERWIAEAVVLADIILARFADRARGGFFFTADDHETLVARPAEIQDGSTPSATAMAVTALLRLGKLTGRTDYLEAADKTLRLFADLMQKHPMATAQMLIAFDFAQGPTPELVLIGDSRSAAVSNVLADLRRRFWPAKVVAARPTEHQGAVLAPLFEGKGMAGAGQENGGEPVLYVCENFACREPIADAAAITAEFDRWNR
ncbi:MAG TPA: thioredoxin domain-containing protein [Pirellulales bacterium]|nr:thioredoxin domain-containing protein [Pirellulales bacterium]